MQAEINAEPFFGQHRREATPTGQARNMRNMAES
jgi:hypothetical protein